MKTLRNIFTALAVGMAVTAMAQEPQWDQSKYPDYDPIPHINQADMRLMRQRMAASKAAGQTCPDHWNNALSEAFPPVMNQSAGSCGSASRIYYMFSHEMNASRGVNGKLAENIYPTHFTWLLTWVPGEQGKEDIAQHNGIPNSVVYGGTTYSELFGYQDCDSQTGYDYGWMQGYDKWFHAMHNRISSNANFADALNTEEGREIVKNYLWNHCGDESYATGGIVGVGVSSGGNWQKIPKTTTNDELGVTGKYYVKNWGPAVDHALTIVGYDDRIEFDLDGNGVKGEVDKDEVGAWIIVNSWGAGWLNSGFVYCPYAEARPTSTSTSYWTPEYYNIRRDYKPLRTLKVKMDYDHRSEIALYIGYSKDLEATKPDKETWLRHFYYAGLSKGVSTSAASPDPAIPMLGRWADGQLHDEPMEFGYDLTDLVADVDPSTPLKYFFRIETRSWARGEGTIHNASIIDYAINPNGIETPFEIEEGGVAIQNKGKKTTITTIVRGESVAAPRNLSIAGQKLSWMAPARTQYDVQMYKVYCNGTLETSVAGNILETPITEAGTYTVSAVYSINGNECESAKSGSVTYTPDNTVGSTNTYLVMREGSLLSIPSFNAKSTNQFTIDFWLRPDSLSSKADNFGIKSSSGKFFFKINKAKKIEIGFDGGDYATSARTIATGKWIHFAITANNGTLTVFVNGIQYLTLSSGWSNVVGGVGNLVFGRTEGTTTNYKETYAAPWMGAIDELRIWPTARTQAQVKSTMKESYIFPALAEGISHYYKMDTRTSGSYVFLVDAISGNDATISNPSNTTTEQAANADDEVPFAYSAYTKFTLPETISAGMPLTMHPECAPGTTEWAWTFTGADISSATAPRPVVVFTETGEQTVTLTTKNINGETTEEQKTITVNAVEAPQADFTISLQTIAAGEHVSFTNTTTPIDDCTYEWTLTGADIETARTINASATYLTTGTYTVRLTATNAAGTSTKEKQIEVVMVAPQSAFTIHNNIAIVGEDIQLVDETKYEPDTWSWKVNSTVHTYMINGRNSTLKIDEPGLYNVSLTTSNEKGTSTVSRSRAITVCAYDGQTGLKFDDTDDELIAPSPFGESNVGTFSIDFWLHPSTLTESCMEIGDSEETFLLRTGIDGAITLYANGNSVTSISGLVRRNEWHHYAITYNYGTVNFYLDGTPYGGSFQVTGVTASPAWTQFRLGGVDAPMNAIIDELRIWNQCLTYQQIKGSCNAPIDDPEANTSLVLYYDFNQSYGDVIDKSSSKLAGKRYNFGPDGDSWTDSKGIFYLNFKEDEDVTQKYLTNYVAPFLTTSGFVNGTSRFQRLQTGTAESAWIQSNSAEADGVTTEFYVDAEKEDYLTLSTTWDGFATEVKSLKLYQIVELPAGIYTYYALPGNYEWAPAMTKTVVSLGDTLPDWEELDTKALASSYCGIGCKFTLTEPTKVCIGLVSNQSGQKCIAIRQLVLTAGGLTIIDATTENAIEDVTYQTFATSTLQATGGLGSIEIQTTEPQMVNIHSLGGQLIWSSHVDGQTSIRLPKGLYIVGGHKVIVR
ncbi:MAG: DUF5013 domain-containing protein [Bacteroidaceae bacterium]|nr:DUF5013 domain-containing protein [Bacteroidaceae bacterium]